MAESRPVHPDIPSWLHVDDEAGETSANAPENTTPTPPHTPPAGSQPPQQPPAHTAPPEPAPHAHSGGTDYLSSNGYPAAAVSSSIPAGSYSSSIPYQTSLPTAGASGWSAPTQRTQEHREGHADRHSRPARERVELPEQPASPPATPAASTAPVAAQGDSAPQAQSQQPPAEPAQTGQTPASTQPARSAHTASPMQGVAPVQAAPGAQAAAPVLAGGHYGTSQQHPPQPRQQQSGSTVAELTPPPALNQSNLVDPVQAPPKSGWRKFVHSATGGKINPGSSRSQKEEEELLRTVNTPLRGDYRIAVMSLKGGVGKTTTTVALGGVFAKERGDRVIAIDANPDLGTLAQRAAAPGPSTIRDLLAADDTTRYPQVRAFTNQAKSRLEVIGSERDPAVSEAFSESDYRHAIDILQHHYNIILTDCGTGLMHSAMAGVLDLANTLVLVTSPALDGAQSASATLDWLTLHGYGQLAANSVVVVSSSAPGKPTVDVDELMAHFRARTRAVELIPYDRHLAEGAVVDLDRLAAPTQRAYRQLAAVVAEDFGSWHRHAR